MTDFDADEESNLSMEKDEEMGGVVGGPPLPSRRGFTSELGVGTPPLPGEGVTDPPPLDM